jgi:Cdc6-like AAA superfamily ATPase
MSLPRSLNLRNNERPRKGAFQGGLGAIQATALQRLVEPEDLIPDRRLKEPREDKLEHEALARSVAEIALVAETPTNIALFGPWGSGKSSVYSMVDTHLRSLHTKTAVVRYDAWKYGGQALKRNFLESISEQLLKADHAGRENLHENSESIDLRLGQWLKSNWCSLILGVVIAAAVASISLGLLTWISVVLTHVPAADAIKSSLQPAGTVLGLALIALLVGPKALEGAIQKRTTSAPSADDQFSSRFTETVDKILEKHSATRLIVFIDELDRCSPGDVVSTLVDLKTFLDQPNCVFIVAADRDVVESSLKEVPQAKPVRDDEPYYATPGAFLDKIFQHQVSLPPLRPRALTMYARRLVSDQGGVWSKMRAAGDDLFGDVIFALVPIHVLSPRRVKVLLNNFATNARIAEARGLPWLTRAKEIAVLTVLQTEFPSAAVDMLQYPRLLESLRKREVPESPAAAQIVRKYLPAPVAAETEEPNSEDEAPSPSGSLLTDGSSTEQARIRLRDQLILYIEKIAAASIPDPRPDLFYLQQAGHADGALDPALADAIDFVTDTPPDALVALFEQEPSATLAAAVPLIVAEGDNAVGPGRRLAFESACRLIELMDAAEIEAIVREIAPPILAAALDSNWPMEATPGAVLLSFATGSVQTLSPMLQLAASADTNGEILARVAQALPFAADEACAQPVYTTLAESYEFNTSPLTSALSSLPIDSAIAMWNAIGLSIVGILDRLARKPQPALVATDTATPAATADKAAEPDPSEVLSRLDGLIEAVAQRTDGSDLLEAVFGTLQKVKNGALRAQLRSLAPGVVQQLSEPRAINQLVLRGIRPSQQKHWPLWTALSVPEPPTEANRLSYHDPSGGEVLTEIILPEFFEDTDREVIEALPPVIESVARLCNEGEAADVRNAFQGVVNALDWNALVEALSNDASAAETLWLQRNAVHKSADALRQLVGHQVVDEAFARDLNLGVRTIWLEEENQRQLLALVDGITPDAARLLVNALADFEPVETEQMQVAQVRLHALAKYGGPAPALPANVDLDEHELSRDILSYWLGLRPPVDSVVPKIVAAAKLREPIAQYAAQLPMSDRTELWVAAEKAAALDQALDAIGRTGLDAKAIDHMRSQLDQLSRQSDRDRLVHRTMQSVVRQGVGTEAARKSVSAFALDLLARDKSGDATLAGRLIVWAGGSGANFKGQIQVALKDALKKHKNAFSKQAQQSLAEMKLLPEPRKSVMARVREAFE